MAASAETPAPVNWDYMPVLLGMNITPTTTPTKPSGTPTPEPTAVPPPEFDSPVPGPLLAGIIAVLVLALGGLIGYIAVVLRQELVVLLMCAVFLAEIGSVVAESGHLVVLSHRDRIVDEDVGFVVVERHLEQERWNPELCRR